MHLYFKNVNHAFHDLVQFFADEEWGETVTKDSRNGPVMMIEEPVIITYEHPLERVLFNPARDANPFFHLFEALWMLAGSNLVEQVAYYAKQMNKYSDDGRTLNGAYGHRWRRASGGIEMEHREESVDQLDVLINHLKTDPNSRRAVLQMWNVEDDLLKIDDQVQAAVICPFCKNERRAFGMSLKPGSDSVYCKSCSGTGFKSKEKVIQPKSKDVCCNLSVMFSIRRVTDFRQRQLNQDRLDRRDTGHPQFDEDADRRDCENHYLDMTVTNRSNDLIWGCLGANYVHFSFLQEYMANCLGVEVGRYHHVTNNLHVYTETNSGFKPEEWLAKDTFDVDKSVYPTEGRIPLVKDKEQFDREVREFVQSFDEPTATHRWREPFISHIAVPMCNAFHALCERDYDIAISWMGQVVPTDWHNAGFDWLLRRKEAWEAKQEQT